MTKLGEGDDPCYPSRMAPSIGPMPAGYIVPLK